MLQKGGGEERRVEIFEKRGGYRRSRRRKGQESGGSRGKGGIFLAKGGSVHRVCTKDLKNPRKGKYKKKKKKERFP